MAVGIALWVPQFIAVTFFINFFSKDTDSSRSTLPYGCLLVIISCGCIAAWNTFYYLTVYKNDSVYTGTTDTGYLKQTKKQFIVWSLFSAAVIGALYAYFICVCKSYSNTLDPERKNKGGKKEAPKDDAKKEDSKDDAKKDGDMDAKKDGSMDGDK